MLEQNNEDDLFPSCNNPTHEGFKIYALCLKSDCKYPSAQCCKCTLKLHKACVSSSLPLEDIPEMLKPFDSFLTELNILQNHCNRSRLIYSIEIILKPIQLYIELANITNLNRLGNFLKQSDKVQKELEILFKKQKQQVDLKSKSQNMILEKNLIAADSLFEQGKIVEQQNKYQEALHYYEKALELNPNLCEAWNNKVIIHSICLGLALLNLEKYQEAFECYEEALKIDSEFVYSWNGKGEALLKLDKFIEAMFCFDKALNIDPNYREAWNNKGVALDQKKKFQEAIVCFENAIKIDKKFPQVWNGLGNTLLHLEKFEEAIDCYEQALKQDNKFLYAWNGKGEALRIQEYKRNMKMLLIAMNKLSRQIQNTLCPNKTWKIQNKNFHYLPLG